MFFGVFLVFFGVFLVFFGIFCFFCFFLISWICFLKNNIYIKGPRRVENDQKSTQKAKIRFCFIVLGGRQKVFLGLSCTLGFDRDFRPSTRNRVPVFLPVVFTSL